MSGASQYRSGQSVAARAESAWPKRRPYRRRLDLRVERLHRLRSLMVDGLGDYEASAAERRL